MRFDPTGPTQRSCRIVVLRWGSAGWGGGWGRPACSVWSGSVSEGAPPRGRASFFSGLAGVPFGAPPLWVFLRGGAKRGAWPHQLPPPGGGRGRGAPLLLYGYAMMGWGGGGGPWGGGGVVVVWGGNNMRSRVLVPPLLWGGGGLWRVARGGPSCVEGPAERCDFLRGGGGGGGSCFPWGGGGGEFFGGGGANLVCREGDRGGGAWDLRVGPGGVGILGGGFATRGGNPGVGSGV